MSKVIMFAWVTVSLVLGSVVSVSAQGGAAGYALRFYGNGVNDIDRVKIRVDDPATNLPGPPADVGATDFTLEFWLRGLAAENTAPAVGCGPNNNWLYGNIVMDRDRYNQTGAFGLSIAGGVIVFGLRGDSTAVSTICGTTNVLDGQWHHIAVQRRRADGWLWLYVNGRLEAEVDGPDGDVSYPDDGIPGNFCGGPCTNSDPYLVLGAEKHDAGPEFRSFAGWLDEVRLSNALRYAGNFARPTAPFVSDASTVALYHFDEGSGDLIRDTSGAAGGPSDGVRRFGGAPPGPEWVPSDVPFTAGPPPSDLVAAYSFNEGSGSMVADASGSGNAGTISGATWTSGGRFGNALFFNGADTWITIDDSASLDLTTAMTLEAWVYPTASAADWRSVIVKEGSNNVLAYFLHASSSPNGEPAVGLTTATSEQALGAGLTLPVNTWSHLAATYDGATLRLYVNGVEAANRAISGLLVTTASPLRIGGNGVWGEFFQGTIDEVRIYSRALTVAEIRDDMNTPVSQAPAPNPGPTTTGLTPASRQAGSPGFTLTVAGTNFVSGSVVRWNGANRATTYVSAVQLTAAIPAADIAAAGTATVTVFNPAPGGGTSNAQTFTITAASNPVPTTTGLSPASAPAGGPGFTLAVTGTELMSGSVVRWNGADRATTYVSATQLTATIPAADIAAPGTAAVTVFNPAPGGGTSNAQTFTITTASNPAPTTTGLNPASSPAGGPGFSLTVAGTNFVSSSVVLWNGTDRATTFVSATQLTAAIPAADIAATGTATVTVFTPAPGGGTSNAQTFTIAATSNPVPTTTGLIPASALAGGPVFTLTVTGTNFISGSIVRWNGTDRATTFVSGTQLTAAIPAADVATAGTAAVTVFTPPPGGGTSNPQPFSIVEPGGTFFDDFSRADNTELGNGWVEKTPGAFSLTGARVSKAATGTGYADNLVYRPASENMLDREASVEVRFGSLPPGYAQVFVRGQTETIATPGTFSGYLLFTDNDPGRAFLSRIENGAFVSLAQITIVPGLNTTDTFRLRLRATGTDPVMLGAFVERFTGTEWTVIGQATVNDSAPTRFATAGTVGFTGYIEGGVYTFDNFTRTDLAGGAGNPTPITTGLAPESAVAGTAGLTLTVTGSGFMADSVVRWNGAARPTTFVSATEVRAALSAGDLGVAGTAQVTVVNPAPGGGTGNVQYFSVLEASGMFVDTFSRPDSAELGNGWTEKYPSAFAIRNNEVVLIDTGSIDYHDAIAYRPAGEDRRDVEVGLEFRVLPGGLSFPQVHGRIQRNTITQANTLDDYMIFVDGFAAFPGRAVIARQAPVPGQFECYMLGIPFPAPLEQNVRYRLRLRVEGDTPVTLTGFVDRFEGAVWQVFASGTVVHDGNTQPIPGDYCDPGFMPPPISTAGAVGFAKWRTANEVLDNFSWTDLSASPSNPLPATTSLSPVTAASGGPAFTLTVNGSGFVTGSRLRWNGADRPTTYVSATQLTAAIPATDIAAAGTAQVSVFNPAPGGGASNPQTFTITDSTNPLPSTTALSPATATAGGPGFTLAVTGANFVAASVVRWNGAARSTTYVSATQ
ncbi:MAG: LamG-like jellyroll fold domain-containing protein, partial [Nocardioidaceae bacterium]